MNRNILAFGVQGHQLIIAGNEYADIMEVLFLDMFDQGVQETSYSENVYLAPATSKLVEFQTVHGSADDLTGQGIVNPSATLKAAATILKRYGRCKGIESAMDYTIETLEQQKICTPDRGGTTTTAAYVCTILDYLTNLHSQSANFFFTPRLSLGNHTKQIQSPRSSLTLGLKTGLLIIDFQKISQLPSMRPPLPSRPSSRTSLACYPPSEVHRTICPQPCPQNRLQLPPRSKI